MVSVLDDADAFMIFETLNDRGLALTVADLVKNFPLGSAAGEPLTSSPSGCQQSGVSIQLERRTEFTTFIRQWWSSLHGATRERDLYRGIRRSVTTEGGALEKSRDSSAAPLYAALLDPGDAFWAEKPPEATAAVTALLELGLAQHRPLLLAAMANFSDIELVSLLRALVSWSVRGFITGGIGGGTTERYYAEAAVAANRKVHTAAGVFDQIESIIPTDGDFFAQFSTRRVNKFALIKYIYAHYRRTISLLRGQTAIWP